MNKNSILTPFIYHCCIINYDINDSHALSVYFYDILIVTSVFDQAFNPYLLHFGNIQERYFWNGSTRGF